MKKRLFLVIIMAIALCAMLALTASAAVTTYDDAPSRTNIQVLESDLIVFDDGFTTLSAYVVKDSTSFGWKQNAYDFSFINGKTGKTYTYDNIKEIDIPQGIVSIATSAFASNKNIVRVSFPDSVTTLGGTIFEYCSNLQKCSFEHNENSELETIPNWFLAFCTSLTAVSFPDCVKYVTGNAFLGGCTSLGAVYLPKNLISTEGGQNTNGTYGGCTNMYFVNEPFAYDNIPAKPDVYYFPAGYKSITGEAFDTCKNLNKVLVFQADGVTFDNAWTFENVQNGEGGKPIIVFTGDVTSVSVGSWNVDKILFSNANDVDTTTAGVSGSKTLIFCANESDISKHIASPKHSSIEAATCYSNERGVTRCFCTKVLSEGEVPGTMLTEHNYIDDFDCTTPNYCENFGEGKCDKFLDAEALAHIEKHAVAYADGFAKNGLHTIWCDNADCKALDDEITLEAMLGTSGGYSVSGNGGLAGGWTVNTDLVALFNEYNEKDVQFGILMLNPTHLASNQIMDGYRVNLAEGKSGALQVEMNEGSYANFSFMINGFDSEELAGLELIITAYAYVDGEAVQYIQDAETACKVTEGTYADGNLYTVTYEKALSVLDAASLDAIVPGKED